MVPPISEIHAVFDRRFSAIRAILKNAAKTARKSGY
jgi:hypothetical protein